ncbi:MAG: SGNH/GDSL hydrolase family protein [Betaproteobacteria bacterium]
MTIFAKGNLDLRDTLHALRVGGAVRWNGINEIVRARHPATVVRVRHETCTRSDALAACDGTIPPELAARRLPLDPYSLETQFSAALYDGDADAYVLSIQPDIAIRLMRHRRDGTLFMANAPATWDEGDRRWLHASFERTGLLDADASMRHLGAIVARLRTRTAAPILVYNVSSVVPGDSVHSHEGVGETLATRIRRFNVALADFSARTGASIVDVDAIIARAGADATKLDAFHLNAEGCRVVAGETVRILEDLGVFAGREVARC